jgi:LAO/AO transport system kinase
MSEPSVAELVSGIFARDRASIGRALTWLESSAPRHRARTHELLVLLCERPRKSSIRVGLSGPPGAGKSTLIEALGTRLVAEGHAVGVLAVDPSSARSGGSIMGDKTRMPNLSRDPSAFVRPSPNRSTLGGVGPGTREQRLVLEAAGFDVVVIETVGVGQSEIEVASMVDTFLLLWLPDSGDELQGIKRGIVELADVVLIAKADADRRAAAEVARLELESALHYLRRDDAWATKVCPVSAREGTGLEAAWNFVLEHRAATEGTRAAHRAEQDVRAMWRAIETGLLERARSVAHASAHQLEEEVRAGRLPALVAASRWLEHAPAVSAWRP